MRVKSLCYTTRRPGFRVPRAALLSPVRRIRALIIRQLLDAPDPARDIRKGLRQRHPSEIERPSRFLSSSPQEQLNKRKNRNVRGRNFAADKPVRIRQTLVDDF